MVEKEAGKESSEKEHATRKGVLKGADASKARSETKKAVETQLKAQKEKDKLAQDIRGLDKTKTSSKSSKTESSDPNVDEE